MVRGQRRILKEHLMGKPSPQVKETPAQKAMATVTMQRLADFRKRWMPVQQKAAADIVRAGEAGSFERRRAATMSGADNAMNFGMANKRLTGAMIDSGASGSSKEKLAITGMGADQATSVGLGEVAADQAVTDQTIQGLNSITAMGRGESATATSGMQAAAADSAQRASADAETSLRGKIGDATLAGQVAGMGYGLWNGRPPQVPQPGDPNFRGPV
jgi:hypothetical protein